jgi:hypothetical protein
MRADGRRECDARQHRGNQQQALHELQTCFHAEDFLTWSRASLVAK